MSADERRSRASREPLHRLLRFYPPEVRARFGAGMSFALRTQAREARRRGRWAWARFWVRATLQNVWLGATARIERTSGPLELLSALLAEVRPAVRRLCGTPAFTVATLLTLALGLGATTAIHAVVDAVLIDPLPHPESERLVWIGHAFPGAGIERLGASQGSFVHYREQASTLEAMGLYEPRQMTLAGEVPVRVRAARISHETIGLLLSGRPPAGRWLQAGDDLPGAPRVALLGNDLWQSRHGGRTDVIGAIEIVDGEPVEIVGVLPAGFRFLSFEPQLVMAARLDPASVPLGNFAYEMVARMRPGVTPEDVARDLTATLPRMAERFNPIAYRAIVIDGAVAPLVEPLVVALTGPVERTLWLLLGAVLGLLSIALANVVNLVLVRAEARRREGWIRTALGAGRWQVARGFLAEGLLLAVVGALLGIIAAGGALGLLRELGPRSLPRLDEVALDLDVLLAAIAVAAVVGAVLGWLPLMRRTGSDLSALDSSSRGTSSGMQARRLRHTLVVAQVALALVLLIGAGLMLRTFRELARIDPGFDPGNAIVFRIALTAADYPSELEAARFQQRFAEELRALGGVRDAGGIGCVPLTDCHARNVIYVDGRAVEAEGPAEAVHVLTATSGAFAALGIPVLEGREFEDRDVGASTAIVSAGLARRLWPDGSALGQRIHPDVPDPELEPYTIVGVVGDHHGRRLIDGSTENLYLSLAGSYAFMTSPRSLSIVVRSAGGIDHLADSARSTLRRLDPAIPIVDLRPLSRLLEEDRATTSFAMLLLVAAGTAALALGMIGVYGVLAHAVACRTSEIGIRMALGAESWQVRRLVTRQGLWLVGAGVGVGSLAALGLSGALASALYGVSPTDPLTYVTVALVLGIVALLASWVPASRAARIAPVEAMRAE